MMPVAGHTLVQVIYGSNVPAWVVKDNDNVGLASEFDWKDGHTKGVRPGEDDFNHSIWSYRVLDDEDYVISAILEMKG